MPKIKRMTWMTKRRFARVREVLRECPNAAAKAEGLACLRYAEPNYLCRLIRQDHPDRIAAMQYIETHDW